MTKQNILFVASEMAPFIKTGGLGDVVGALPKALKAHGVDVRVVIPLYSMIDYTKHNLHKMMDGNCVQMGNCQEFFSVHTTQTPEGVPVYFIEFNKYFNRNGVYNEKNIDFPDNAYRFAFFDRAALQVAKDVGFKPDVVHIHDWQTGLIPYFIASHKDPFFDQTKTLLTLHNLPYQGRYSQDIMSYAGIGWDVFHPGAFEDYGMVNFLKGGLRFATKINTVSPNYAREILTPEFGAGLDFLLRERQKDLSGILNGIDTALWNPSQDTKIPTQYSAHTWEQGKKENKQALQSLFHLKEHSETPIFSMAVRLAEQKGIKMLAGCIEPVLQNMDCQFVIMGQGEPWAQEYFGALPKKYPGKIGVNIGFQPHIEHLMDAGSDFSLVPSLYEPCGLKQMISQTYGALPVVRSTGGLEDTVLNYNEHYGLGTGFKFYDTTPKALYNTIGWANATYFDRPQHIGFMRRMAMDKNYSWDKSSRDYYQLYQRIGVSH